MFNQIEKNKMYGACSTIGERRAVYRVVVGRREGDILGIPGVDCRIILRWIFMKFDLGPKLVPR
jgi:hypothetical protein